MMMMVLLLDCKGEGGGELASKLSGEGLRRGEQNKCTMTRRRGGGGFFVYMPLTSIVNDCLQRAHENPRPFSRLVLKTAIFGVIGRQTKPFESCLGGNSRPNESDE